MKDVITQAILHELKRQYESSTYADFGWLMVTNHTAIIDGEIDVQSISEAVLNAIASDGK